MVKKYVITGGPCAGKTSIVLALDLAGEQVVRECAEDFIRLQKARGIKEPNKEPYFQDRLLEIQIAREMEFDGSPFERVFLDGGIPDFLVYYPICGEKIPEIKIRRFLEKSPYEMMVFFAMISKSRYERTRVRREELTRALEIESRLMNVYTNMGYELVPLQSDSLAERVNHIINLVGRNNGR